MLNVEIIIKTVQQPQDNFAGHGAGVPPLPCLAVPTDIGNQLEPKTGEGFYEYSSLLCLLVTALSFITTARSDKLKALARVGVFSTAITKFN